MQIEQNQIMNFHRYTYGVAWVQEDREHVALCLEFPALHCVAKKPQAALTRIQKMVGDAVANMQARGEFIPVALR